MLVYLGQAVGELVLLVVDGVREWQLDPFQLGEDALHLRHNEVLHAVVVVDMQEPSTDEVGTEVLRLTVAEDDIAVTCHVDKGIVEQFGATHLDGGGLRVEAHLLVLVAEGYEVLEGGGVGIPVTAAAIFEQGYLGLGGGHAA